MKKRSNDAKSNPGYNSSGRSGNVVDRQLIQRVEQYMEENKDRPVISICQMAQELHTQYREYTRKKMTPFRIAVENAYISVCNRRQSEHEIKDSLTVLEEKHLKKRQRLSVPKKSSSSSSDEDDKSFSSNADDYVQYPESNLMNSVITDMYRKKASGVGIRSGSAEETACPVVSTSSGLSYCIDRTGVPPVHTMPESDQHQPSVSSSGSLTVDSVKATATTQGESAADDIIVIEDGRDHDNNLLTRVNMPEHSTTVDVRGHCSSEEKLAKKDVATRATYRGKSRKRSLPESTDKEPTSRKKFGFEVQQSTTRISEFGGSVTAVWEVIDNMLHMKQSAVRRLGVAFPRGILLHGPPGCGKTLLANAVAGEVGCSFIKMSSTQLISGVSGDSRRESGTYLISQWSKHRA